MKYNNSHQWDGVTRAATLKYGWSEQRVAFARMAAQFRWKEIERLLDCYANPNDYQLDASHWNNALHWAAIGGAPLRTVEKLLASGAWRSLPNRQGLCAFELAKRNGHKKLLGLLEPEFPNQVTLEERTGIQKHITKHFADNSWVIEHDLRIPEISVLFELEEPKLHFPIPGRYGNENMHLSKEHSVPTVIVESYCRVVGGPVPRWECTPTEFKRVPSVHRN